MRATSHNLMEFSHLLCNPPLNMVRSCGLSAQNRRSQDNVSCSLVKIGAASETNGLEYCTSGLVAAGKGVGLRGTTNKQSLHAAPLPSQRRLKCCTWVSWLAQHAEGRQLDPGQVYSLQ